MKRNKEKPLAVNTSFSELFSQSAKGGLNMKKLKSKRKPRKMKHGEKD